MLTLVWVADQYGLQYMMLKIKLTLEIWRIFSNLSLLFQNNLIMFCDGHWCLVFSVFIFIYNQQFCEIVMFYLYINVIYEKNAYIFTERKPKPFLICFTIINDFAQIGTQLHIISVHNQIVKVSRLFHQWRLSFRQKMLVCVF